jgi:hypothetical protein
MEQPEDSEHPSTQETCREPALYGGPGNGRREMAEGRREMTKKWLEKKKQIEQAEMKKAEEETRRRITAWEHDREEEAKKAEDIKRIRRCARKYAQVEQAEMKKTEEEQWAELKKQEEEEEERRMMSLLTKQERAVVKANRKQTGAAIKANRKQTAAPRAKK